MAKYNDNDKITKKNKKDKEKDKDKYKDTDKDKNKDKDTDTKTKCAQVGVVGGSVCLLGFYPRRLCCKSPYHRLNENLSKYEMPNKL